MQFLSKNFYGSYSLCMLFPTSMLKNFHVECWKIFMLKYFRRMSTLQKFVNTKIYLTKISYHENFPIYGTRFGIKVWVLPEAKSGYVLDFQVYTGGSGGEKTDKNTSLGQKVVLQLMEPYQGKGAVFSLITSTPVLLYFLSCLRREPTVRALYVQTERTSQKPWNWTENIQWDLFDLQPAGRQNSQLLGGEITEMFMWWVRCTTCQQPPFWNGQKVNTKRSQLHAPPRLSTTSGWGVLI